jgi:hypothetical protein
MRLAEAAPAARRRERPPAWVEGAMTEREGDGSTTLNTVCPVCGAAIDPEVPPVNLSDEVHPRILRVCGGDCADIAIADAERYLAAAAGNRTADQPDDRPVVGDEGPA